MAESLSSSIPSSSSIPLLSTKAHVGLCRKFLGLLPTPYQEADTSKMTLVFFCLSSLDILDDDDGGAALDSAIPAEEKRHIVEWIYSLQITDDDDDERAAGFRGGHFLGTYASEKSIGDLDLPHVTMTYTALISLLILGDDLSRVRRKSIIRSLRHLQAPNGSFSATARESENDMRFLYCACVISYVLNDWSGIDQDLAYNYIVASQNYDGGIGQGPGQESHGGSTFCAVASLHLMNRLKDFPHRDRLLDWCVHRQETGFQGRPHKPVDTCYSFWVGGSLKLLDAFDFVDRHSNEKYIMSCEKAGGFAKWVDTKPDLLHSYLGLCGLCLNSSFGLPPVNAALNISERAAKHLHEKIMPTFS